MKRRKFLISSLAGSGLLATGAYAQSSPWPNRPARIVLPFPPGGGVDATARVLAKYFSQQLNHPVVVENHTGGGGSIGVTVAAQSKDAHTLLFATTSIITNPHLGSVRYDIARDFDAIGMVSVFPQALVVPANSKYRSVSDILADMRARPGQVVCGNGGSGTTSHLAIELFMNLTGVSCLQVPYRGEAALAPDIVSGTIPVSIPNIPGVLPHIRSGRIRALAVATSEPNPDLPGVSTFDALGVPGMESFGWAALLAAKGIPEDRLADLERMLKNALATESVAKSLSAAGLHPFPGGRSQTEEFIKGASQRVGNLIRARNIKAN